MSQSQIDVERFRQRLLEERQRVVEAIEYLHEENPGSLEDEEEMPLDNHLAETATMTLDREIDYTLEDNAQHVLAAINGALKRIDEGTFGICARCGRAIEEARLEIRPYATLCIDDQRKEERG